MKKFKKKELNSSNGITLIALVITIIVLLILAGISISMLSGNNSILIKAENAKTQTDIAQEKEIIALAYNSALVKKSNSNSSSITDNELNDELDNSEAIAKKNNPIIVTFINSKRKYIINNDGEIKEFEPEDRTGINVGDYVNYTPKTENTTYSKNNLDEVHTGSTNNKSLSQQNLKWRVLTIHEDGTIDLIANPTNSQVYFKGATGYNNGVYIMHEICKNLYSNIDHCIEARSVSLEDFEYNITDIGKETGNASANNRVANLTLKSGSTVSKDIEKNTVTYAPEKSYYPNLYASENGAGINNSTVKTDGIVVTEKASLDLTTGINSYKQANIGLTSKQTAFGLELNETNFGDSANIFKNAYKYWVAARRTHVSSYEVTFSLYAANTSLTNSNVFFSRNDELDSSGYLRPVVQIGNDIKITISDTASNSSGTPHIINW